MFKFRKKSHQEVLDKIPNHIGIIMDGNGRWAKKRLQPRVMGHKAGMDALPVEFFNKYVPELDKNNVRILTIGDNSRLPKETLEALEKAVEQTKHNSGLVLNFALNYGGRAEIVSAVQAIAKEVEAGKLSSEVIDEDLIAKHLMTDKLPYLYRDPDLIIRTSGELRLSNFLPWQSAYSEFYFTDVFWPDFDQKGLRQAISDYNKRHRRFGGV